MSDEKFAFVKCCKFNRNELRYWYDNNCFSLEVADNLFYDNIYHCPWCGILLDTNLLE